MIADNRLSPRIEYAIPRDLRAACAWLPLLALLLSAGCAESPSATDSHDRESERERKADADGPPPGVTFAPLGSRDSGGMFLQLHRIDEALTLDYPGDVGPGSSVRFIAALPGPAQPDALLRAEIVVGGETRETRDFEFVSIPEDPALVEDPLALFAHRHQYELGKFAGEAVSIRFRTIGAEPGTRASLYDLCFGRAVSGRMPDILFICSDAHRVDYATSGNGPELMPELAAFTKEAVRYDRAWSTATWTLPAITSVHTGLYPNRHTMGERRRVIAKSDLESGAAELAADEFYLGRGEDLHVFRSYPPSLVTFPEILQQVGYRTAIIAANAFYYASGLMADGHDIGVNMPKATAARLNETAEHLLAAMKGDQPVFLLVHYLDVHEYLPDQFMVAHPGVNPWTAEPDLVRDSYAVVARRTDAGLGRLLDLWENSRRGRESLIVFYSDHGEHLFDPGYPVPGANGVPKEPPPGPESALLDHGNSMDETLLHVPLVVRYPASMGVPAGVVTKQVSLADLFPTVLSAAGLRVDGVETDGVRLPVPGEAEGPPREQRAFYAAYQLYGEELASVRRGDHKLVISLPDLDTRLVDIRNTGPTLAERDAETDDPELIRMLKAEFDAFRAAADNNPELGRRTAVDESSLIDDMRALGYLK